MPDPSAQGPYRSLVLLIALALIAAGVAVWQSRRPREQPALSNLSQTGRAALYEHQSSDFRTFCAGQSVQPPMASFCKTTAERLLQFPECDDACRTAAKEFIK